jgi:hypothetical protein
MSMRTEPETRPEMLQVRDDTGEDFGSSGLIHLAACCGDAGAAALAVVVIEWLI